MGGESVPSLPHDAPPGGTAPHLSQLADMLSPNRKTPGVTRVLSSGSLEGSMVLTVIPLPATAEAVPRVGRERDPPAASASGRAARRGGRGPCTVQGCVSHREGRLRGLGKGPAGFPAASFPLWLGTRKGVDRRGLMNAHAVKTGPS